MDRVLSHRAQARRSNKRRRQRTDYAQLDAFARKDLRAVSRHWTGKATLSDDASGQQILHGLLMKGLPATQVLDVAPWASQRGIEHYVEKANADHRKPDADMLGNLIEFTFDDLKAMKRNGHSVRHIAPFDADRGDVQQFWIDEERIADRERKQRARKRRKENTMPTPTKRAKIIHKAMSEVRWTSVSDIMDVVAPKLRDQRNRMLAPHALRVAVHRALDQLVASGLADKKTEIAQGVATRLARRAHMTGQVSVTDNTVTDHRNASDDVASQ